MPIDLDPAQPGEDPAHLDPPANSPAPVEEPEKKAEEEAPNGVLIVKGRNDAGDITIDAVPLGTVEATEVQTLIELGLVEWRRKIGLDG